MTEQSRPQVLVIGGGPAGLAAAETLTKGRCEVTLVDHMPSFGRKLLMAGRSGLNLTNAEQESAFLKRYGAAEDWLTPALSAFSPSMMTAWAEELGQPCFTGSSGRVFPKTMKASPLLRAWLKRLADRGVHFRAGMRWQGWNSNGDVVLMSRDSREEILTPDATVLALGGGSWTRLGSDGGWVSLLSAAGVPVAALRPANCGFHVEWSEGFRERFSGVPLKRIALSFAGETCRGEAVITDKGLEGGAVYTLSARLRDALERDGTAEVLLDLRPDFDVAQMTERLKRSRARESLSNRLRKALQLPSVAMGLLRETGEIPTDPERLAQRLKAIPIKLTATEPLERAISSAGGICRDGVDQRFMLKVLPGVFACGEMLDWEAPTGGYLLQAVMATGRAAGQGVLTWLAEREAVA
ncbi:TIGR03862 family flavoprotein [Acetobacter aceti]|uniref:NAD(FAD)-utilizing dehydrogenase n=1 Tax=Acetobacter aceti TaxID=435 RepID=A0A6S6PMJ0_ACEAC|nr:TIGR03862 family flavoprotein [Acetobacter aceti]BCI67885.1 NAD(FAD)-utilizing dehydrogenase [Acetobacter aceti]